jgi:transposase
MKRKGWITIEIKRRDELKSCLKEEKDYELKFKLSFLNLVIELQDVDKACDLMAISVSTGYRWIKDWNEKGKEGLRNEQGKGGGKPPKLSGEKLKELENILRKEKDWWTTKEVIILLKERFGIEYSEDQVVRILKKLKMNHGKPYPQDYRRPDNAQEILDNQLSLVLELIEKENIPKDKVAIGFLDETSSQTSANTVRVWSFGKLIIKKNTTKISANTIGYYALIGNSVEDFLINSKAENISDFLVKIKEANIEYSAIIVILDNFRSHISKKVKEKARELNIYLVYLPPYSPDLNPIEFIWKSLKRVLSLLFIKTEEELKDITRKSVQALSKNLSYAKSWINRFLKETQYYQMLCG